MMNRRVMSDEILVQVERLSAIAGDLGVSMAQLALAWCLRLPDISSVISCATKTSQLDDNIKASGIKLPQDICDRIDQILKEPASVSI